MVINYFFIKFFIVLILCCPIVHTYSQISEDTILMQERLLVMANEAFLSNEIFTARERYQMVVQLDAESEFGKEGKKHLEDINKDLYPVIIDKIQGNWEQIYEGTNWGEQEIDYYEKVFISNNIINYQSQSGTVIRDTIALETLLEIDITANSIEFFDNEDNIWHIGVRQKEGEKILTIAIAGRKDEEGKIWTQLCGNLTKRYRRP